METLKKWALEEEENGVLLLLRPLFLGIGILIYFLAPDEPNAYILWGMTINLAVFWFFIKHQRAKLIIHFLLFISLGLSLSSFRTHSVSHPVLSAPSPTLTLKGYVEKIERREANDRVTLLLHFTSGKDPLQRVRVVTRQRIIQNVGDGVEVLARLMPPNEASRPEGYDFARDAWFNEIAAVGFTLGAFKKAELPPPPLSIKLTAIMEGIRTTISTRIRSHIAGESGAFADALVTGRRDGISQATNDALRAAGTFHILSISGFHMSLVAAFIFGFVRGLLAFFPFVSQRFNVKAFAALITFCVTTFYLMLAGAETATIRSWVMIALIMLGVMTNRMAFTLHTLAIAALIILMLYPETLLSPSFQMSFAATLVLVAGYNGVRQHAERLSQDKNWLQKTLIFVTSGVLGLALSSLFAGLATTPFTAYHFNQIQLYGLFGNVMGAPLIEFFVMPMEIIALVLWSVGLDAYIWQLITPVIDLFLRSAHWIASWKGNTLIIPSFNGISLTIAACGFSLLLILKTKLRFIGLLFMILGGITAFMTLKPLLYADSDATTIMALIDKEHFQTMSSKPVKFVMNDWQKASGVSVPKSAISKCDALGCVYNVQNKRISVLKSTSELALDCAKSDIIITKAVVTTPCKALVITEGVRSPYGGRIFYTNGTVKSVKNGTGHRLWQHKAPVFTASIQRPSGVEALDSGD